MSVAPPGGAHVSYRQQYRRCGKAACSLCAGGGAGHGPYWYATWQEGGRTRARYLGKALPAASEPEGGTSAAQASADGTRLRVRTLGGFEVWRDGVALPARSWAHHRAGALFKWLLAAPDQRLSRDGAIELLWPEATQAGAANLRVLIHRLRRALGEDPGTPAGVISYDGEMLALLPGVAAEEWLDAAAFARAAARALAGRDRAACRAALARYTGEYLPDDPYDEWALGRRDDLRRARSRLLLHLAGLCRAAGELEEAAGCLHAVLAEDRCHEDAALALMRLHAEAARPGAALRVYRHLVEALREELGLPPSRAAQALAVALRTCQDAAPPVPAAPAVPNNLPGALTSFVGRGRELAALRALLSPGSAWSAAVDADRPAPCCRLLTLVGPGGVGKTRLALALAEDVLEASPDGVWFVDLSGVPASSTAADPLIAHAVAGTLGLREEVGRPAVAALIDHLKGRRVLLVLDNCEHVLPACAALVAALLPACRALRIVATSRETLGVAGEQPWSVPALSLPVDADPARLAEAEAVRLFLARARVQRPDLEITADNAAALASICRQLDGLPLALELAAARAGLLSLEAIAARLRESLRLLTGGPRGVPARQRTLRATLDWSYGLLDGMEQALLRRLAVFGASGCTLEAVEAVCADPSPGAAVPLEPPSAGDAGVGVEVTLDLLEALLRKSLLLRHDQGDTCRYRLLETVRQYAAEHLERSEEFRALGARHAAFFLALAERADADLKGAGQQIWLARLEAEHDNLRAALRWAQAQGEAEPGLRLAGALWRFWRTRGHLREGLGWLEAMLRAAPRDLSAARARALRGAGVLAREQGDLGQAVAYLEESLAIYRATDDRAGLALTLNSLGNVATFQGDYARAMERFEECLALSRATGDRYGISAALSNLSNAARAMGDYAQALAWQEECVALRRDLGDTQGLAISLGTLGNVARRQGNYGRALAWYEESLALRRQLGDIYGCAVSLNNIGEVCLEQGDLARAAPLLRESVRLRAEIGHKDGVAEGLANLARVAHVLQDHALAARLLAAATDAWQASGTALTAGNQADLDRTVASVRAALGEHAFAAAWQAGSARGMDDAIGEALSLGVPEAVTP